MRSTNDLGLHAHSTPVTVTQASAPAVLGISSLKFRSLIRAWNLTHGRQGRLFIVRLDDFLAALAARSLPFDAAAANDAAEVPLTADEVLAQLGARRAPKPPRKRAGAR